MHMGKLRKQAWMSISASRQHRALLNTYQVAMDPMAGVTHCRHCARSGQDSGTTKQVNCAEGARGAAPDKGAMNAGANCLDATARLMMRALNWCWSRRDRFSPGVAGCWIAYY